MTRKYAKLSMPEKKEGCAFAKKRVAVGDSCTQGYVERNTDNMYRVFQSLVLAVHLDITDTGSISDIRSELDDVYAEAFDKAKAILVRKGIIDRELTQQYD